jgi:hypothetical protein
VLRALRPRARALRFLYAEKLFYDSDFVKKLLQIGRHAFTLDFWSTAHGKTTSAEDRAHRGKRCYRAFSSRRATRTARQASMTTPSIARFALADVRGLCSNRVRGWESSRSLTTPAILARLLIGDTLRAPTPVVLLGSKRQGSDGSPLWLRSLDLPRPSQIVAVPSARSIRERLRSSLTLIS